MAETIVRLKDNPDERARFRAAGLGAASQYSRDKRAALMLHVLERLSAKTDLRHDIEDFRFAVI